MHARPAQLRGAERTGPERWRALGVTVASHAVQHFYVGGLALTYPLVVVAFHTSYGALGVVLTIAGVLGGLLQGAAGMLRRVSARAVLAAQNLALGAATILSAAAPGFALFGAARTLGALVSWPQHPVGSAYLSEHYPQRRAAALSWHTAGGSIGTVIVPLVASAVIATAGWRWALLAIALPMIAGGLAVWWLLPADHKGATHAEAHDVGEPAAGLRSLLLRREVLLVLAASTVAAGGRGLGTISAYLPAYLKTGLGLGPLRVGLVFTVVMAASVVGPVVAGTIADRLGRARLLVWSYLAGGAAIAGFVWVGRGLVWLCLGGAALGVLAYAESPLLQAVFADATGHERSRAAFGVFFAIAYGIGAAWLAVLGWVIDAFGFRAAFSLMACSFAVAAALIVASRSSRPARPS